MGVIYGYISLTDKPFDPSISEAMRKANSFWEPDGDELWYDEHAAMGSLIMFNTPEAIFEKQPIHFEDNHKVLVATARIDNRDDLCRNFDIPLSARDMYPDSYYIRLAYEKWGEACPDHLIGDWSFAVWDKVRRKLFVARDHHGIMACYYYQGPDFFVFSSSLKGILCLPQVPKKVNEYKIAQILVNWNEGGTPTCYQDIFRLPPAHTLSVENKKVTTDRYWYLEHTPEIHLKNDQEYIDMFRELYTEAVRCRLRSYRPVGATLSGGLDSGSVCILAAQELAKQGKRLPAFTAVPMYDVPWPKNRIGDEGPLALALAEKLGNVDVTLCRAEGISPLEGVEKMLEVHDQPGFATGNAYWITDIFNHIKYINLGTLLIGQGGNGTVSWPTNGQIIIKSYIKFILKRLYFKTEIWRKNFIVADYYLNKREMIDGIKCLQIQNPILTKEGRITLIKPGKVLTGDRWFENGIFYKTEIRDATVDKRLMSYLISIPLQKKNHFKRFMFATTFHEYFPEDILKRNYRGKQAVDISIRMGNIKSSTDQEIFENLNNYINQTKLKKLPFKLKTRLDLQVLTEFLNTLK